MTAVWSDDLVTIHHANALDLPLDDETVDLVVTSPPYFGLRSYVDGGEHYAGQIGSEATPGEFVDALIEATREMVRVLKPSGSIWVNLGDKYAADMRGPDGSSSALTNGAQYRVARNESGARRPSYGVPKKSLLGLPWRYAIRCVDELGLVLRAEVVWAKPNGLPESVTDRVRRSHEQWFHFTLGQRYFSAIDTIREPHTMRPQRRPAGRPDDATPRQGQPRQSWSTAARTEVGVDGHPLGRLPGSVWEIPTQPLDVPEDLGVDHFAAFPMEWPRRIIQGWTPSGFCTACKEPRRPVMDSQYVKLWNHAPKRTAANADNNLESFSAKGRGYNLREIVGERCACEEPSAPTTPAVVLDPFGGTGTTALAARALGRRAVHVDLSRDYCRLATWRLTDPGEAARALGVEKPPPVLDGQSDLLDLIEGGAA